jgi:hypothetical protein
MKKLKIENNYIQNSQHQRQIFKFKPSEFRLCALNGRFAWELDEIAVVPAKCDEAAVICAVECPPWVVVLPVPDEFDVDLIMGCCCGMN